MTPILRMTHVSKTYDNQSSAAFQALTDISFEVQPGEFVGVMGVSGAGKTTLLNIASSLDVPTSGQVQIAQQEITTLKGNLLATFRARQVGFIFQDFKLLNNLTVAENIGLPLTLQRYTTKQIKAAVLKIAQQLGLTSLLSATPAELSSGQQQQVAIARALVHQPAILFGDEPTGALDSNSTRALLETLFTLNQQTALAILLTTHDPLTASYCQRVLFMKDGRLLQTIRKENQTRAVFYQSILRWLTVFES